LKKEKKKMRSKASITVALSFIIALLSCTEEETSTSIPNSDVYIKTNYNDYTTLKIINNSVSYIRSSTAVIPTNFRLGYGGVLIYRDLDGKIQGCDLSCPVEASRSVLLEIKMPYATCPQCGSKFDLSYGFAAPCGGPAKETLKKYKAVDNGSEVIVSN